MPATRTLVHQALTQFQSQPDFRAAATSLFKELGYQSSRTVRLNPATAAELIRQFNLTENEFNSTKAHIGEWEQVEFLFQFGEAEVKRQAAGNPALELFTQAPDRGNKNSFFFHAVRLKGSSYRRSLLADITRQLNRPFGLPTVVLFQHGDTVSLGVINRRPNKKDATREVLEKVTLIKDISLSQPHAAHVRILDELRLSEQVRANKVTNFDTLLHGWQTTLSISELNKRFYRELANWYFWAVREVRLPAYPGDQGQEVRHATAMIRLITRIIFTWFLKEKGLVPDELFKPDYVYDELLPPPTAGEPHSTYYKAVLQNLFFATLNTEMRDADGQPNRRFLPPSSARNQNAAYGEAGYLRYQDLFSPAGQTRMLDLVNQIPFLNGGLFECLDPTPAKTEKGQPKPERVLIDCFSNGNQHLLHVPDELFFAEAHTLDLSPEYGEKTRKKETVRGLLPLLNRYKFTIAENTPLEEEVALDPELLGKVFENLLAAYNPETQTTARKQTGSFYTPREVVEYMVDESLLAYLRPHLPTAPPPAPRLAQTTDQPGQNLFGEVKPTQATLSLAPAAKSSGSPSFLERGPGGEVPTEGNSPDAPLRYLLAHPEAQNPFSKAATWKLIQALDALKLLDPACGSGAFPMGALQRLTYLLARLDPNNKLWKQQQLDRAEADRQMARGFMDEKLRQQAVTAADRRIQEITAAFDTDNHELDYARKLFLIENCLYGVDIQPVAVQITKLRCFIALLVEQKADTAQASQPAHNLGIRPLPNLETKFVAANTLLRLEEEAPAAGRQVSLLAMDNEVLNLRRELRDVRHQYFTVRGRTAKLALRAQDADLRQRLGRALQRSGMPAADAHHLADWNPYDLKLAADFFSPKWMLGVDDGFDVVIGNPPYVNIERISAALKKYLFANYESCAGRTDLYIAFIERGLKLLRPGAVLTFIIPYPFTNQNYAEPMRKMILERYYLREILDTSEYYVFETAVVKTVILQISTETAKGLTSIKTASTPAQFIDNHFGEFRVSQKDFVQNIGYRFETKDIAHYRALAAKIKLESLHFEEICFVAYGARLNHKEDGTGKDYYLSEVKQRGSKPFTEGKMIERFRVDQLGWLNYQPSEHYNPMFPELFETEKLVTIRVVHSQLRFAFDTTGMYNSHTVINCVRYDKLKSATHRSVVSGIKKISTNTASQYDYSYLLGILNSSLMSWYFANFLSDGINFYPEHVKQLPIFKASQVEQRRIILEVNQILAAKAATATADTTALERQVDALVYKLYDLTDEEIALVEGRSV